jgi:uncharacterized protein YjbI with pentapeptide repeats/tetratricopeptide (TPR) repeat protein
MRNKASASAPDIGETDLPVGPLALAPNRPERERSGAWLLVFSLATSALAIGIVLSVASGSPTILPGVGSALIGGSIIGLIFAIVQYIMDQRHQQHSKAADLRLLLTSTNELAGIDLSRQNLANAYLRGKNLASAQLAAADLTGADLRVSALRESTLISAALTRARLDGVLAQCADLTRCDLRGAAIRGADLGDTTLRESWLDDSDFTDSRLDSADLSLSRMQRVVLEEVSAGAARLVGVDARLARLAGASLDGASLALSDLTGAHLFRTRLRGADLTGTRLNQATLMRADLSGAQARGCSLVGADLTGACLRSASLESADLREAILTGCDLRGADLTGALLAGAQGLASAMIDDETRRSTGWSDPGAGHGEAEQTAESPAPLVPGVRWIGISVEGINRPGLPEAAALVEELRSQQELSESRMPGGRVSLPLGIRAPRKLTARPARMLDGITPGTVRVRIAMAGNEGDRTITVALMSRCRTVRLHSIQLCHRPNFLPGGPSHPSVLEELAARVLNAVDPRDGASWWVRAHIVRAIKQWDANGVAVFDECRRELEVALTGDPLGPAVNYALGALAYNQYEAVPMRRAITYFAVAYAAAGRLDRSMMGMSGLILCGIALTRCQLYHRFGEETADALATSRTAARMAVVTATDRWRRFSSRPVSTRLRRAALEGLALAKYAEAFAQHITGTRADAEAAIPLYREAIDLLEGAGLPVRAVLYNNLGFQYMVMAGQFERGADAEAYRMASKMFHRALEVYEDLHFAWANLGNMQRLHGDWKDAEDSYLKALEITDRLGTSYPQGHNELAQVLAEAGRAVDAAAHHQCALDGSDSPELRARFRAEYGRSLLLAGRRQEARDSGELGLEEDPDNFHCRELVAELRDDEGVWA